LKVEASTLLQPFSENSESAPATLSDEPPAALPAAAAVQPVEVAPASQDRPAAAPEQFLGQLAVGVSLTTVKEIVAATHKRLEALERRHGSVPMTREMLTSVLVTLLNASQNIDGEDSGRG
jgi:hypothetical protein